MRYMILTGRKVTPVAFFQALIAFCFLPLVMDISDIIKGKAESDDEKQYFIPFHP